MRTRAALKAMRSFLLNSGILDFVQAAFDRVVLTSTCAERQFARLSEWSGGSTTGGRAGSKPQLSSIASKHCNHTFSFCVSEKALEREAPQWCRSFSAVLFYKDLLEKQPDLRSLSTAETQEQVRRRVGAMQLGRKARWANPARGANLEASHSVRGIPRAGVGPSMIVENNVQIAKWSRIRNWTRNSRKA